MRKRKFAKILSINVVDCESTHSHDPMLDNEMRGNYRTKKTHLRYHRAIEAIAVCPNHSAFVPSTPLLPPPHNERKLRTIFNVTFNRPMIFAVTLAALERRAGPEAD